MLVTSKSVPIVVDKLEQSMASLPVTLKGIVAATAVDDATERVTVGEVSSTVTVPDDAADNTPRASLAYALYVPSSSPLAEIFVSTPALEMVTWFHNEPAAPVMLARFDTLTDVLTK